MIHPRCYTYYTYIGSVSPDSLSSGSSALAKTTKSDSIGTSIAVEDGDSVSFSTVAYLHGLGVPAGNENTVSYCNTSTGLSDYAYSLSCSNWTLR